MTTPSAPAPRLNDVAELRRVFDQTFAAPEPPPPGETDDFLLVRAGGRPFALRVLELARLEGRRRVVALPGSNPWLLGLATVQGQVVPVYRLEAVLGAPGGDAPSPWLVICGGGAPLGLAFGALEGYARVPRAEVLGGAEPEARAPQAVRAAGALWPVVSLAAVAATVRGLVSNRRAAGES